MGVRSIPLTLLTASLCLWAELLPVRSYTTADGLPTNQINSIMVDSRGFVWFSTPEGLSRFDGHRMVTFGMAEGLPAPFVDAALETRDGAFLVATIRGLCQLRQGEEGKAFVCYAPDSTSPKNAVTAMAESSDGHAWLATWPSALFQMLPGPRFVRHAVAMPPSPERVHIQDIVEDSCGKIWAATNEGISIGARNGALERITQQDGLPGDIVNALYHAKDGKLWAGVRGGLALLRDGCTGGRPGVEWTYPAEADRSRMPRPQRNVQSVVEGPEGAIWASTAEGIMRVFPDGRPLPRLTRTQGLTDRSIFALAADHAGNMWVGTEGAGAMILAPGGFTTFRESDGLASDRVWSVLGDRAGKLLAVSIVGTTLSLNIFDGARFRSMEAPRIFAEYHGQHAWGSHRILLQSRGGEWWAATAGGLCRYAPGKAEDLRNRDPEQCYFRDDTVFQVFEDSKGGIWASSQLSGVGEDRLVRWDPDKKAMTAFPDWPRKAALVKSFAEDRKGNVWLGMWGTGTLCRYDGQRFTYFGAKDGLRAAVIYALLTDTRGRLWMGTSYGLGLVEHPEADRFRLRIYDQANGISNSTVVALLEDEAGFIYLGTGAGVDRLDPETGHIKHFSAADGVPLGQMESSFRDPDGNLWFATAQGLARLTPAATRPPVQPTVWITGLQSGGEPAAVSGRGESGISGLELEPSRNQLQVEFVAFGGEPEANLRYAYKLEGGEANWSAPTSQHTVNFAALGAGRYRFLVKAVNSDGVESARPAEVDFTVLPPFWRRWWFEALALAALASIVYLLHSYRVTQMVNLERMRTAIATDLHDDLGSSLSQIAVLSEVARASVNGDNPRTQESLQRVAVLAREMVDSVSDIVWSIRAVPDGLDALAARMRQFALDLLAGQRIDFQLRSTEAHSDVDLSLQARRHLFLMFKECIHNVVRHSGCTAVQAELTVVDREIVLTVADNGRGIPPSGGRVGSDGGNGIPGMRRRAEMLGGSVQFDSRPGGCTVSIRLPLRHGTFAKYRV